MDIILVSLFVVAKHLVVLATYVIIIFIDYKVPGGACICQIIVTRILNYSPTN